MYCNNCGANLPDGTKFCSSCGMPVMQQEVNLPPQQNVYQPPVQRDMHGQPPVYQQPVYQQPTYQPPAQQPVYQQPYAPQYYPPVIVQQNASEPVRDTEPERKTNGPAVAGIVFGVLILALLLIYLLTFPRAAAIMQNSYNSSYISDMDAATFTGLAMVAMICYWLAGFLYLFNFIFGLIGFIRSMKNKIRIGAGITAFFLLLLNGGLLIWELFAFVMTFAAMA